ncbi:hypothetical protein Bhyg_08482, partial [Pseudolycoriella hygida]
MSRYQSLFLLCLFCLNKATLLLCFTDSYFESAKFVNPENKFPFCGNITVKRTRGNHPTLFSEIKVTDTLRNYEFNAKVLYSRLGNNQFVQMPVMPYRAPLCSVMNTKMVRDVWSSFSQQNCSNFPTSNDPNIDLCDLILMENHYYLRKCSFDLSIIDVKFIPAGRFRVTYLYYKGKENKASTAIEI